MIMTVLWGSLLPLTAQEDTVHLDEVVVVSSALERTTPERGLSYVSLPATLMAARPAATVAGQLALLPGVDVRLRGAQGAQADVSLRGGSFDQTLVLLDGFPVTDPLTGHHDLALPVPPEALARLEVQKGPAAQRLGPGAFAGAVNLVTLLPQHHTFVTTLSAGSHNTLRTSLVGGIRTASFSGLAAAEHYTTDGYRPNTDVNTGKIFMRGRWHHGTTRLDMLGGWLDKAFGANAFYSPAFPGQYERYRTGLGALRLTTGRRLRYTHDLSWRRGRDRFTLFRTDPPSWYRQPNVHRSDAVSTTAGLTLEEKKGYTSLSAGYRYEGVLSNLLGEPLHRPVAVPGGDSLFYDHAAHRHIWSVAFVQRLLPGRWDLSGGLLLNKASRYGWHTYGGMTAGYTFSGHWRAFLSAQKTLRFPTFTELYYRSPVNMGDPGLRPEKAFTLSGGTGYKAAAFSAGISLFLRKGTDLIDWVRTADTLPWQATNHGEIHTRGLEISGTWDLLSSTGNEKFWLKRITFSWAWTGAGKEPSGYVSRYVLDYLRHQADLIILHRLPGKGEMGWTFSYRDRAGYYLAYPSGEKRPYDPYLLTGVRVRYPLGILSLFFDVNNLFDVNYMDFGELPAPGIWVTGGISLKVNDLKNSGNGKRWD